MHHDNQELFSKLSRLQWLMGRFYHHKYRQHGPMGDIHRGQGRILALLHLQPEISQKNLTQILDMRPQSLGELLAKLERSGYIERTPSETDHRVIDIRLTEAGKEISSQVEPQPDTQELFGCLSEEEQSTLSNYLSRIVAALEQKFGDAELEPDFDRHPPFGGRGMGGRPFDMEGGHPHRHGGHPGWDHGRDGHPRRDPSDFVPDSDKEGE